MKKLIIPVLIVVLIIGGIVLLVNRRNDQREEVELPKNQAESQTFMEDSAEKFDSAETFQMNLTQSGTSTIIGAMGEYKIIFDRANGVTFVHPNRLSAKVSVLLGDIPNDVELIVIGEKQYVKNPILTIGNWAELTFAKGFNAADLRSEELGISTALVNIDNLEVIGREEIDGVPVYHFKGEVEADRVRSITVGLIGTASGLLPIDIYVRARDQFPARLVITEVLPADAETGVIPDPTVWEINFFGYNQDLEVEEPADAEILPTEAITPTEEATAG